VIDNELLLSDGIAALHGGPSYTSDVPVMTGVDRDEFAINLPVPTTSNVTEYIRQLTSVFGVDITPYLQPLISQLPNTTDGVFTLASTFGTTAFFKCLDQALAHSAAKHNAFASIYRFEFNRTYSPREYTTSYCDPPKTVSRPFGDPDKEYFKCHAGEQLYVFGILGRGLPDHTPDRDGHDILFSQLVVDYWASFARNHDPNPELDWLRARGFQSTIERVEKTGRWRPVTVGDETTRVLQWDGLQVPLREDAICGVLGLPLTYYETAGW
jgi:carboxylesterase type B